MALQDTNKRTAQPRRTIPVMASCALLCSSVTMTVVAEPLDIETKSQLFIPTSLNYYNPLKHGANKKVSMHKGQHVLDNAQLEAAAEHIRTSDMSAEQRALNHQWLDQQEGDGSVRLGNKVLSSIMRMGFKTYWTGVRNKHYKSTPLPDGNGNGKISEEVDYKLRLSQDKVRLMFEYEF